MSASNPNFNKYQILYGTVFFFLIFGIAYPMIFNYQFEPYHSLMLAIGFLFFMLMSKGLGSFLSNTQMSTSNQFSQCIYLCKGMCCNTNDCSEKDVDKSCYDDCHNECKTNAGYSIY